MPQDLQLRSVMGFKCTPAHNEKGANATSEEKIDTYIRTQAVRSCIAYRQLHKYVGFVREWYRIAVVVSVVYIIDVHGCMYKNKSRCVIYATKTKACARAR